ncbi:MAG: tyrosine-type recombinase/integrase [Bacteroidota bacterium]
MKMYFKLRTGTVNKSSGLSPVLFFYTHNSPYIRLGTGVEADIDSFDGNSKTFEYVKGDSESNKRLKIMWIAIENIIEDYQHPRRTLPLDDQYPSGKGLKELYIKKDVEQEDKDQLIPLFKDFVKTLTHLTYTKIFYTIINDIETMYPKGLRLSELDDHILDEIKNNWIQMERKVGGRSKKPEKGVKLNNTTIVKRWQCLKRFLEYIDSKIAVNQAYKSYKLNLKRPKEDENIVLLKKEEYNVINTFDLNPFLKKHPNIEYVRNLYVLSCETALRFSDVKRIDSSHIKFVDNIDRVMIKQIKTRVISCVPVSDSAKNIILWMEQNKMTERSGFKLSEQKIRDNLKLLFELVLPEMEKLNIQSYWEPTEFVRHKGSNEIKLKHRGLEKGQPYKKYELLNFHSSRKYFCTSKLAEGHLFKNVMKWSSHTSMQSFSRYLEKGINEVEEWNKREQHS